MVPPTPSPPLYEGPGLGDGEWRWYCDECWAFGWTDDRDMHVCPHCGEDTSDFWVELCPLDEDDEEGVS